MRNTYSIPFFARGGLGGAGRVGAVTTSVSIGCGAGSFMASKASAIYQTKILDPFSTI